MAKTKKAAKKAAKKPTKKPTKIPASKSNKKAEHTGDVLSRSGQPNQKIK